MNHYPPPNTQQSTESRIQSLWRQIYQQTSPQRRELRAAVQRCVQLRTALGLDPVACNTLIEYANTPEERSQDYAALGNEREPFITAAKALHMAQSNLSAASKAALVALGVEDYGPAEAIRQQKTSPSATQIARQITLATRRNEMQAATRAIAASLLNKQYEGHSFQQVGGVCR